MYIEVKEGSKPVFYKLRKIHKDLLSVLTEEVNKLLKTRLIYPLEHSDWWNPIMNVLKHTSG